MKTISGSLISQDTVLTFEEICRAVHADDELIIQLIEYHIIQPKGSSKKNWKFDDAALKRVRLARNFYYDLEVNLQGIALRIDMLEKIEMLETEIEKRELL